MRKGIGREGWKTSSFISPDEWKSDKSGDGTPGSDRTIRSWFDAIGDEDLETPHLDDLIVSKRGVTDSLQDNGGGIDLIPSHPGLINADLDLACMTSMYFLREFERKRRSFPMLPKMEFPLYCVVTSIGRTPGLFPKSNLLPRNSAERQV